MLHSIKQGNDEGINFMALKLDMAKAYDRVKWPFLNAILHKLGFNDFFYQWVIKCVQTVSYSVVINGEATGYITPCRGLHQGDPLLPFLFLICAEDLSALIQTEERVGRIRGMTVNHLAKPLSHVSFADDSVLFCQATETEAIHVNGVLQKYVEGFGQFVNLEKSSVYFRSSCLQALGVWLSEVLGIKYQKNFGKYLGIQADFRGSKKKVFKDIRIRLEERINGWAKQFLSVARKEVLL